MPEDGILRIIDVNFNRSKEGLRVIEDVFRFILVNDALRKKTRKIRHSLVGISQSKSIRKAVLERNSKKDIGKEFDHLEAKRTNCQSILYANFQRVKESLRVLEEFLKLSEYRESSKIKIIRYEVYNLEKNAFKLLFQ